ncbi:hypothetical protein TNCT_618891 [Trichonephila clavata]|uniref:Uncharacterized protein n=1 Tax=Trichonephila clavata TaxID=2740835 RepID=A0A8X6L002_TRICU|nr:hypothetical protein TNCT_618891 [Trichonephila clavata]
MASMDVDPPDKQGSCCQRNELESTIIAEEVCIVNFSQIIDNRFDTEQNAHLKGIVRNTEKIQINYNKDKVVREPCVDGNASDLVQVIELAQLISRILKRSPEILNLLPKLKQAEKDNNAAYVLVEALLDKK